MQEDDKSQEWQQPTPSTPGAPYESVPEEAGLAPGEEDPVPSADGSDGLVDASEDSPSEARTLEADESIIQWQATEYVQHDRSPTWFIVLALTSLALIAIAIFLMQSISFAILVPVMAAALVVYVRRPPALIDYIVSRKGIHVNDRLHPYDEFRSFGILTHEDIHSIVLVPRKRFQLSQTLYFPEEVGEGLVDMLAARLPMNEVKQDAIDRFLARLRL